MPARGGESREAKRSDPNGNPSREAGFATVRAGELITDPDDPRLQLPWYEDDAARAERERIEAEARKKARSRAKREAAAGAGGSPSSYDPRYVTAARELCARFLEEIESPEGERALLAAAAAQGKHEVRRSLEAAGDHGVPATRALAEREDRLVKRLPEAA